MDSLALKPFVQIGFRDQEAFPLLARQQIALPGCPVGGVMAAPAQLGRFFNRDGRTPNHGRIPVGLPGGFLREYPRPRSPC